MHLTGTLLLPLILSASRTSLCAPSNFDIEISIVDDDKRDQPDSDRSVTKNLAFPPISSPAVQEVYTSIDGDFSLQVGLLYVGPSNEEYRSGWRALSLQPPGRAEAKFTLEDGFLRQGGGLVTRFPREDRSLLPKQLYVTTESVDRYHNVRWHVISEGQRRTLRFLEGDSTIVVTDKGVGGLVKYPLLLEQGNADLVVIGGGAVGNLSDDDARSPEAAEGEPVLQTQAELKRQI